MSLSLFSTAGLARASSRRPWIVVVAWVVVLAIAGGIAATSLGSALTTKVEFLNQPESVQGFDLLKQRMGFEDPLAETVIITSTTKTVEDPAFQSVVQQTVASLRKLPFVDTSPDKTFTYYEAKQAPGGAAAAAALVSKDGKATIIPVAFKGTLNDVTPHTDEYMNTVAQQGNGDIRVLTVGDLSVNHTFNTIAEEDLQKAEAFGIPAALIILIIVFGALIAAGIPVVLAMVSIVVSLGLTAIIGQVWDLSFFITNMITMIGLAVGIDYALFIVERYREERRRGREKLEAIEVAGGTASKAVLFSGTTVVLALLGMFLIPTTIFRSLGLGAILVVIVSVIAMLTLIPAILSLLGDRIDWPRRRRYDAETAARQAAYDHETIHKGFWGRVTKIVMGRPVIAVVVVTAALAITAIPYFSLNTGFAGVESLPQSEAREGFELLSENFAAGRLAPLDIVIDANKSDQVDQKIATLDAALRQVPTFAMVQPVEWSKNNDLGLIRVTLAMSPNDPKAFDTVEQLRNDILPPIFNTNGDTRVLVTGESAFNKDFFILTADWTPIVFAFVLALSFILLMLVFRSIVVPAKAILMNLLSVGAAYGLMVLVFQKGYLHNLLGFEQTPTIEAWIPIFLFCVLFGLSMDYHVFLLSRIREHYDQTHRNRESVAVGLQSTARIITGAALIMVAVFIGFASGRLVMLQQIGFGLAVAVFIDATVVRSILVPAAMTLLGDRNWYLPRWLNWLPDLRVEGTPLPVPAAEAVAD